MAHKAPTYKPASNLLDRQVERMGARASVGVPV
ncbi:hypothetical protein J2800_002469 [Caulobacter rhizosphaerae]|jgi:hypothetical protein|uniref:Uncharacterized protein n=1 Tax=Caulobacter rhizosphaerae TaxID=2010972 RepID=A0ABU1MZX0_9CAUL|nr:hypothetical protein [Caulobacter rhizosphaerae]